MHYTLGDMYLNSEVFKINNLYYTVSLPRGVSLRGKVNWKIIIIKNKWNSRKAVIVTISVYKILDFLANVDEEKLIIDENRYCHK